MLGTKLIHLEWCVAIAQPCFDWVRYTNAPFTGRLVAPRARLAFPTHDRFNTKARLCSLCNCVRVLVIWRGACKASILQWIIGGLGLVGVEFKTYNIN